MSYEPSAGGGNKRVFKLFRSNALDCHNDHVHFFLKYSSIFVNESQMADDLKTTNDALGIPALQINIYNDL